MKGLSKIVGGLLGFLLAGPGGCLLGILIGHVFDKHFTTPSESGGWSDAWVDMTHSSGAYPEEESDVIAASDLQKAYRLLGVSKDADPSEIKQAYRRAMSRYHPDRLSKQNLTPAQLKRSMQKLQQIKDSYEMICKADKFS